jgi:Cof subfamily protein (haloacid dehalogenase superfamily)
MKRILALDLDDTLLRTDKTVSPRNLAALRSWLAAGHLVVVATGRPPRSVPEVLPPELLPAPRIVYNGAQAIVDGATVYRNPMCPDAVRIVLDWVAIHAPDWHVGLEVADTLYLNQAFPKPGGYEVVDLTTVCQFPAAKMIFFFPNGRGDIAPLLAAVPPNLRALVTPKFSAVQLCAHDADKAHALEFLLQSWGYSLADVIAIGDDVNDVELVRCAGLGIAVENALPEVKTAAGWITASNEDDGVAIAVERVLAGDF